MVERKGAYKALDILSLNDEDEKFSKVIKMFSFGLHTFFTAEISFVIMKNIDKYK